MNIKTRMYGLVLALAVCSAPLRAEFLQMDLSIFGMD
ncbi:MAG: hypothetical protein JWN34_3240 [Bryobacterales bacterium]|jgi:hypothetical protein|nr:hypothetical protein [Bryobacterales bacterium]